MEKETLKKPWSKLQITEIAVRMTEDRPETIPGHAYGKLSGSGDSWGGGS